MLLRTILGLRRPQAGTSSFTGGTLRALVGAGAARHGASYGVTFQNGALISSLTVTQNIQLPLREATTSLPEEVLDDWRS